MPSELLTERRGATLVLTISDPASRNTLSAQVIAAGIEALDASEANDEVRAVVLRGARRAISAPAATCRACSSGAPPATRAQRRMLEHLHHFVEAIARLSEAGDRGGRGRRRRSRLLARAGLRPDRRRRRRALRRCRTPSSASRPTAAPPARLASALPPALAKQIVWLAEPVTAATPCTAHGLVAAVAEPRQRLRRGARASPIGSRRWRRTRSPASRSWSTQAPRPHRSSSSSRAERDQFLANLFHANGAEGLQAFLDKRAPRFSLSAGAAAVTSATGHAPPRSYNRRTVEHRNGLVVLQAFPSRCARRSWRAPWCAGSPTARSSRRAARRPRNGAASPTARCA